MICFKKANAGGDRKCQFFFVNRARLICFCVEVLEGEPFEWLLKLCKKFHMDSQCPTPGGRVWA